MKKGKAYAFFQYNGKREDIVEALPKIREVTQLPAELELSVMGGAELLQDEEIQKRMSTDKALAGIAGRAYEAGMNYAIEAIHPETSHRQTAMELGDVIYGVYQSLYTEGSEFSGDIVYQRGGKYVFRRN